MLIKMRGRCFLFVHQLFFTIFLSRKIWIASAVRNKTNKIFRAFKRTGEDGPSAKGCPVGNRVNVSLIPGIRERKTVVDIQHKTMNKNIGFFFLPNTYAVANKRSIKMPSAWPALKCPVLERPKAETQAIAVRILYWFPNFENGFIAPFLNKQTAATTNAAIEIIVCPIPKILMIDFFSISI